jgi:hypothetical protein
MLFPTASGSVPVAVTLMLTGAWTEEFEVCWITGAAAAGADSGRAALRAKASGKFESYLSDVKAGAKNGNPGFPKSRMTNDEWAELSKQMESEGIVFREETEGGKTYMRMYTREQLAAKQAEEARAAVVHERRHAVHSADVQEVVALGKVLLVLVTSHVDDEVHGAYSLHLHYPKLAIIAFLRELRARIGARAGHRAGTRPSPRI